MRSGMMSNQGIQWCGGTIDDADDVYKSVYDG